MGTGQRGRGQPAVLDLPPAGPVDPWPVPELFTGRASVAPSAEARFEAFEAFTEDLRARAAPDGLLAVLDDLQWADAASLALLVHLARGIGPAPLMILATCRDTEPTGQLSATISALAQEPNLTRMRLVGLSEAEVGEQLAVVTGAAVSPEVAGRVCRRSGGNPFFVAELGHLLDAAGDALPEIVASRRSSRPPTPRGRLRRRDGMGATRLTSPGCGRASRRRRRGTGGDARGR
jgi:hypothetical protein